MKPTASHNGGHDFRPEYRQLNIIGTSFPDVPIIALTATASMKVREDIIKQLKMKDCKKYISSFNRKNLYYYVIPKQQDVFKQIVEYLKTKYRGPGIIYCFSKKNVDVLTENLNHEGYRALPYHGDLSSDIRTRNQEKFMKDDVEIIVATIAFGMGIDKPNIRFVIHHDLPKNLETYYQETGRAGRDGLNSDCVLFYDEKESKRLERFNNTNMKLEEEERQKANNNLRAIKDFCKTTECRRKLLLRYFEEDFKDKCSGCDNCRKLKFKKQKQNMKVK